MKYFTKFAMIVFAISLFFLGCYSSYYPQERGFQRQLPIDDATLEELLQEMDREAENMAYKCHSNSSIISFMPLKPDVRNNSRLRNIKVDVTRRYEISMVGKILGIIKHDLLVEIKGKISRDTAGYPTYRIIARRVIYDRRM